MLLVCIINVLKQGRPSYGPAVDFNATPMTIYKMCCKILEYIYK